MENKKILEIYKEISKSKERHRFNEAILWTYLTQLKNSNDSEIKINLPDAKTRYSKHKIKYVITGFHKLAGEASENHLIRICSLFEVFINEVAKTKKFKFGTFLCEIQNFHNPGK